MQTSLSFSNIAGVERINQQGLAVFPIIAFHQEISAFILNTTGLVSAGMRHFLTISSLPMSIKFCWVCLGVISTAAIQAWQNQDKPDTLDELQAQIESKFHVTTAIRWSCDFPSDIKIQILTQTLLTIPYPQTQSAEVKRILQRLNQFVTSPVFKKAEAYMVIGANELNPEGIVVRLAQGVSAYSPWASAASAALVGIHCCLTPDEARRGCVDIELLSIYLRGFVPRLLELQKESSRSSDEEQEMDFYQRAFQRALVFWPKEGQKRYEEILQSLYDSVPGFIEARNGIQNARVDFSIRRTGHRLPTGDFRTLVRLSLLYPKETISLEEFLFVNELPEHYLTVSDEDNTYRFLEIPLERRVDLVLAQNLLFEWTPIQEPSLSLFPEVSLPSLDLMNHAHIESLLETLRELLAQNTALAPWVAQKLAEAFFVEKIHNKKQFFTRTAYALMAEGVWRHYIRELHIHGPYRIVVNDGTESKILNFLLEDPPLPRLIEQLFETPTNQKIFLPQTLGTVNLRDYATFFCVYASRFIHTLPHDFIYFTIDNSIPGIFPPHLKMNA